MYAERVVPRESRRVHHLGGGGERKAQITHELRYGINALMLLPRLRNLLASRPSCAPRSRARFEPLSASSISISFFSCTAEVSSRGAIESNGLYTRTCHEQCWSHSLASSAYSSRTFWQLAAERLLQFDGRRSIGH